MPQIEAVLTSVWRNPDPGSTLKAKADIQLLQNGSPFLFLSGIKLVQTSKGLVVKMPSLREGQRYHTLCRILSRELRQHIKHLLIAAYSGRSLSKNRFQNPVNPQDH